MSAQNRPMLCNFSEFLRVLSRPMFSEFGQYTLEHGHRGGALIEQRGVPLQAMPPDTWKVFPAERPQKRICCDSTTGAVVARRSSVRTARTALHHISRCCASLVTRAAMLEAGYPHAPKLPLEIPASPEVVQNSPKQLSSNCRTVERLLREPRFGSDSNRIGQVLDKWKLGHNLAEIRPQLAMFGQSWPNLGQNLTKIGQCSSKSATMFAKGGPMLADIGQCCSNWGRIKAPGATL